MKPVLVFILSALAHSAPTFGPEIEFRGRRHLPAMACGVTLYSENKIIGASIPTFQLGGMGVALTAFDEEDSTLSTVSSGALAAGLGAAGLTLACGKVRSVSNRAYDAQLKERLTELCRDGHCRLELVPRKVWWDKKEFTDFKVRYPDGTQFIFSHDPAVIEVNAAPLSTKNLAKNLDVMQADVFDLLEGMGLKPPKLDGPWNGGHVHVGVGQSFRTLSHLRDFLVDLYAHPELGYGILLEDQVEGPSVGKNRGESLRKVIDWLDERLKTSNAIDKAALDALEEFLPKNGAGLTYNKKFRTLELRFIRSQKNAADLLRLFQLLEARIESLQGRQMRVPLPERSPARGTVEERRLAFRQYVEGAGLSWAEFESLAPPPEVMRRNDFLSNCISAFGKIFK